MINCRYCKPFVQGIIRSLERVGRVGTIRNIRYNLCISDQEALFLLDKVILGSKMYPIGRKPNMVFCSSIRAGKTYMSEMLQFWVKDFVKRYTGEYQQIVLICNTSSNFFYRTYQIVNSRGVVLEEKRINFKDMSIE